MVNVGLSVSRQACHNTRTGSLLLPLNRAFPSAFRLLPPNFPGSGSRRGLIRFLSVVAVFGLLWVSPASAQTLPGAGSPALPLTSISQVRALRVEDAAKSLPVRLRGIVVGVEPERSKNVFIHDGKEGCFVKVRRVAPSSAMAPGDEIMLTGVTDPMGYFPSIRQANCRIIGRKPLPPPERPRVSQMFSPRLDSEWIEVPAVVIDSELGDGRQTLTVEVYGNQYKAELPIQMDSAERTRELMQRRVILRGVMGTIFNQDKQMTDRHFFLSSLAALVPNPRQPKERDASPILISQLLTGQNGPEVTVHITGEITQLDPRGFFLRDASGSTLVRYVDTTSLQPGMKVEVTGTAAVSPFRPTMRATHVISHGKSSPLPVPFPIDISADDLSRFHSEWVELEADFLGRADSRHEEILQFRSNGRYFEASIPFPADGSGTPQAQRLQIGDRLLLTGICELTTTHALPRLNWVDGVRLHLPIGGGIRVISSAPWWNTKRLMIACGTLAAIAALAMLMSWTLRRRVKNQMQVISEKLRSEAVGEERDRMARELHDTLEQQLSGVALQLDGLDDLLSNQSQNVHTSLELARNMLRFTREEARRSVWDLRSQVLERDGLPAALRAIGEPFEGAGSMRVDIDVRGAEHALPPGHDFHLLRIAQEALTNAVKHGNANAVTISLQYAENHTTLKVTDDGDGFAPDRLPGPERPRFGVMGMRERAAKISAEFSINSSPGMGCSVEVSVPHPSRL